MSNTVNCFEILFLFIFIFAISCNTKDFTEYVDPTIGNVPQLLVPTYPTFSLPNQMLRMIPVKPDYLADQVLAWPLQVESHRREGLLKFKVCLGDITPQSWEKKMAIDHDLEVNRPWYYSTYLIDDDITVSFVPAKKCAVYKIDFPASAKKNILFSGSEFMTCNKISTNSFSLTEQSTYTNRGTDFGKRTRTTYSYAEITDALGNPLKGVQINPSQKQMSITLAENSPVTVYLKYAISNISVDQAKKNFKAELANTSFENLLAAGKKAWKKVISQIEVEGGTESQKRTFYTALYRTYERMVDINEDGQYYSGYDGKVHQSLRPFFIDDGIWDTYLAKHPLNTILNPQMQSDILNSYVQMYEQSGWMPTFPKVHGNAMCMVGYHSSSLFIDAYRKNISGFDLNKAYEGVRKNLTEATVFPWRQGLPKTKPDELYHQLGYMPALRVGETETDTMIAKWQTRQAVAVTLELCYDNWALSQMAKEMGKENDYKKFGEIAANYKKIWHPQMKLFMPKDDSGKWVNINPKLDGGKGFRSYYTENNGWTYAWQVLHDVEGLISLLGGKKSTEERLDQLFREPLDISKHDYWQIAPDATGHVGQFVMGNEPSLHIPYLYNYCGAPWKAQKIIRFLLDVWFKDNFLGMPGDEDGGGMSAWVVFSAMGFYQVTPGLPIYTIGSPLFEKITIHLPENKKFIVIAKGTNKEKKYIQKAFLNGKEINTPFFTHQQLMSGGTLELLMDSKPNKEWGKIVKKLIIN